MGWKVPVCKYVVENFGISMLLMEVSKCYKVIEFSKISVKMKNFKNA